MFDVTMGSYDGAETCELIGLYMLSLIKPILNDKVGLYRDDGLIACNATPKQIDSVKMRPSLIALSSLARYCDSLISEVKSGNWV